MGLGCDEETSYTIAAFATPSSGRDRREDSFWCEFKLKFLLARLASSSRTTTTHGNYTHFEQVMQQQTAEGAETEEGANASVVLSARFLRPLQTQSLLWLARLSSERPANATT